MHLWRASRPLDSHLVAESSSHDFYNEKNCLLPQLVIPITPSKSVKHLCDKLFLLPNNSEHWTWISKTQSCLDSQINCSMWYWVPLASCHIAFDPYHQPWLWQLACCGCKWIILHSATLWFNFLLQNSLTPLANIGLSIQIPKFIDHDYGRPFLSGYPSPSFWMLCC